MGDGVVYRLAHRVDVPAEQVGYRFGSAAEDKYFELVRIDSGHLCEYCHGEVIDCAARASDGNRDGLRVFFELSDEIVKRFVWRIGTHHQSNGLTADESERYHIAVM